MLPKTPSQTITCFVDVSIVVWGDLGGLVCVVGVYLVGLRAAGGGAEEGVEGDVGGEVGTGVASRRWMLAI